MGGFDSFAPALTSRAVTGVGPLRLAKFNAVSPFGVFALTSAPRSSSSFDSLHAKHVGTRGKHQRRTALTVFRVHVGPAIEQRSDPIRVAKVSDDIDQRDVEVVSANRIDQRLNTLRTIRPNGEELTAATFTPFRLSVPFNQHLENRFIPCECRIAQRSHLPQITGTLHGRIRAAIEQ